MPGRTLPPWLPPLAILAVVILGYGIAPMRLPLIGEEACRAQMGIEMFESGDWLVATLQNQPLLDRPPLSYWVFGLIHGWIHPLDPPTLRVFMLLVTLATALTVWGYARSFLGGTAALVAGLAYPTMGHVFDLGRRAETDGLFTLLLAVALLTWHRLYARSSSPWLTWCVGGTLAAIATLAKGTQAPVTFFGTLYLFLLLRRDWRSLFSAAHGVGLVLFAALIAAWQVPFYLAAGWDGTRATWLDPFTSRIATDSSLIEHLATFPLEVLVAAAPWSFLILGVALRGFWTFDDRARSALTFVLLGLALIFVPAWLSHGAKPRYVMPLYPLLAVVAGAVAERAVAGAASKGLRRLLLGFWRANAVLLVIAAAACVAASLAASSTNAFRVRLVAEPPAVLLGLCLVTLGSAVLLARSSGSSTPRGAALRAFALAASLAVIFAGPVLDSIARRRVDVAPDVRAVRERIEAAGGTLVSFGRLTQNFIYYYEETIPLLPRPSGAGDVPEDVEYFALVTDDGQVGELPFEWRRLTAINMDPNDHPNPVVVVGLRERSRID